MKSQLRITFAFFFVSLSIIVLLSISVYYFSSQRSFAEFYEQLRIRALVAAKSILEHEEIKASAYREIRYEHLKKLPEEREYFFEIVPDKSFEHEATELNLPATFFEELLRTRNATFRRGETFYAGVRHHSTKGDYGVVVSANSHYDTHHLSYLRNLFLIAIPLAALIALLMSWLFSKKVFTPVARITSRVKEISSQNMHLRLEVPPTNDEITELVSTFNTMLDRLETAFETQNNFISNASHELSTPLTAIIGESEVTLSKPRSAEEYAASMKVVLEEAERLEKITRSLLFLAQTGFDGKKQSMGDVHIDALLLDVKATIDKLNPASRLELYIDSSPEQLIVSGNLQLLHLAFTNIISNACKYSSNATVKVSVAAKDKSLHILVEDKGIGIPKSEVKFIYDPFFRASNTGLFEGYGIGLPLTRNIIRLHKGKLNVSSVENEGTLVDIELPR